MRRTSWNKRILALVLLTAPIAAVFYVMDYPVRSAVARVIGGKLAEQGFSEVEVQVAHLSPDYMRISALGFHHKNMEVQIEDIDIWATVLPIARVMTGDVSGVAAKWRMGALRLKGLPEVIPPISGSGDVFMQKEGVRVQGTFLVKQLPLATLLSLLSGKKAHGTGYVSGALSLTVRPGGGWLLGNGQLRNQQNGIIQLSPDALPGDAAQMDIARVALSNFHYTDLSLTTSTEKDGKPSIHLNVEGNNPDAWDGRPVKLHVNLTGDVLELVQQSLLPIADPSALIEKGTR